MMTTTARILFPPLAANPHLDGLRARYGDVSVQAAELPALQQVVLLSFTNRSGSNFLSAALASSGLLNVAQEVMDPEFTQYADPDATSFGAALAGEIGRNAVDGRFILKAGVPHLGVMAESGLLEVWRSRLRFIHIERLDRLGQAISWVIASQTQEWFAGYAGRNGRTPAYDRAAILAAIDWLAECDAHFLRFFALNGIVPLRVVYEAFVADPAGTVQRIGRGLGLPMTIDTARIGTRRQAGVRNQEWRERFLAGG